MRYLFFVFILSGTIVSAQLTKGNKLLGGGISLNSFNSDGDQILQDTLFRNSKSRGFSWAISPNYGIFIKDSVVIGGGINVGTSTQTLESISGDDFQETTSDSYSLGAFVFARKYYRIKPKVGFFINGSLNYIVTDGESRRERLINDTQDFFSQSDLKNRNFSSSVSIGLYYFIFKNFTLETSLANLTYSYTSEETITTDTSVSSQIDNRSKTNFDRSNLRLLFVNNFNFDRLFTFNYYF